MNYNDKNQLLIQHLIRYVGHPLVTTTHLPPISLHRYIIIDIGIVSLFLLTLHRKSVPTKFVFAIPFLDSRILT